MVEISGTIPRHALRRSILSRGSSKWAAASLFVLLAAAGGANRTDSTFVRAGRHSTQTVGFPAYFQGTANVGAGTDEPLPVTVSFIPTGSPRSITIAGTFNGWDKGATHLQPQPGSLVWSTTLRLPPGVYEYRLVVNGTRWLTPPEAPRRNDGSGNINALLVVAPPDFTQIPARIGDGRITASGVFHRVSILAASSTVRTARYVRRTDRGHIDLTLRTRHDDIQGCSLLTPPPVAPSNIASRTSRLPMVRYAADMLFDYWHVNVAIPQGSGALRYAFLLHDGNQARVYDSAEALFNLPREIQWFQLTVMDFPPFETPEWARDAVFYQIFPDRFANGDTTNDPPDVVPWGTPPTWSNRMGGDLAGILERLEYLRDLGINGLYLNPIFQSRSNHGYDTTDYMKVDSRFGSTAALKSLTARAHLHGWHVILDGVFNHTGVDFEPFQSVVREGPKSPYRNWYFIHEFPVQVRDGQKNYEGWNGSPWMPKLNVSNPATSDYLLDVGVHWIREAQIDGWRLDAASEVNHDFWKTFRKTIKAAKPDAYLVGEIWPDATDWLHGDEMDSVTSYRWRGAVLDFFAFDKTSPGQFDVALSRLRADYPPAATAVMFNMLGSHDVERIRTLCRGDWTKERQAVAFQMTYPGTPCIYYGDEIGMDGGKDPDNRRAMPWNSAQWDKTVHAFYKAAIALRQQHAVLRRGDYQTIAMDDKSGVYAYLRTYNSERALVAFNRSDAHQKCIIPITRAGSLPFRTWLDSGATTQRQGDNLIVSLPKRGFAILGH